jgi:hypothetical protein
MGKAQNIASPEDLLAARRFYEEAERRLAGESCSRGARTLDGSAKGLIWDLCFLLRRCPDPQEAERLLRAAFAVIAKTVD